MSIETLEIRSKKKKNIIFFVSIISILCLMIISFINFSLSVEEDKIYKEKQTISEDLAVLQTPEIKESWAVSTENKINQAADEIKELKNEIAIKDKILKENTQEMVKKNNLEKKELLFNLKNKMSEEIKSLKKTLKLEVINQKKEIEQLKLAAKKEKDERIKRQQDIIIASDYDNEEDLVTEEDLVNQVKKEVEDQLKKKLKDRKDLSELEKKDLIKKELNNKDSIMKKVKEKKAEESLNDFLNEDLESKTKKERSVTKLIKKKKLKVLKADNSFNQKLIKEEGSKRAKLIALQSANEMKKLAESFSLNTGFSQAFMITGAYAPAFSEGTENPLPVLFEAEGDIIQANQVRASVDKCFLLGSAKGQMNSNTASIKLVTLSCLLQDGKYVLEGEIKGWIIGENGKPGIPGELLHKNGALLAKTFVSGFLETFASAIGGGDTNTFDFSGNDKKVNNSDVLKSNIISSGGQGLATVFGKIGEYYLKMAEQIFPVIEVTGGRTVDIMFIGSNNFSVRENSNLRIDEITDKLFNIAYNKKKEKKEKSEKENSLLEESYSKIMNNTNDINSDSSELPNVNETKEIIKDELGI